jgi:hypothetical protein
MNQTFINSLTDMAWLYGTLLAYKPRFFPSIEIPTKEPVTMISAILYGDKEHPDRIKLFEDRWPDYLTPPNAIFTLDEETGEYVQTVPSYAKTLLI